MIDYIPYFNKASESLNKFGLLTKEDSLSEKNEPIEIYTLTTLHLSKQHTKAISNLLVDKLYVTVMIILRNLMELFFNLKWIYDAKDEEEKLSRVFDLEGTSFVALEKEVKMMEGDANSKKLVWEEHMFSDKKETLKKVKELYPNLTRKNKRDEIVFREAPPFDKRMDEFYKLKFYNIYRFLSAFVHPSPILREFTLSRNHSEKTPSQIIEGLFPELIKDSLVFIYSILEISDKVLSKKFPKKEKDFEKVRMEYFDFISDIPGGLA